MSAIDKFTHVAFMNVQEAYCHRKDLDCQFAVDPSLSVTCFDFIGVYKVGWKSTRDFVCKNTVAVPVDFIQGTTLKTSVMFDAAELPEDLLEFYQFCYVCNADQRVHGVSPPFQFVADQNAVDWEFVENDSDFRSESPQPKSFIVITDNANSEAEPTAGLNKVQTQIGKSDSEGKPQTYVKGLEEQVCNLRSQLSAALENHQLEKIQLTQKHQEEMEEVKRQHAELSLHLKERSEMEVSSLLTTAETLKEQHRSSETKCQRLESKIESTEAKIKCLEDYISNLKSELREEAAKSLHLEQFVKEISDTRQLTARTSATDPDSNQATVVAHGDADSNPHLTQCPVCHMEFPEDDPVQLNEAHVLAHLERVCPVCGKEFSPADERSFISHVDECLVEHRTSLN